MLITFIQPNFKQLLASSSRKLFFKIAVLRYSDICIFFKCIFNKAARCCFIKNALHLRCIIDHFKCGLEQIILGTLLEESCLWNNYLNIKWRIDHMSNITCTCVKSSSTEVFFKLAVLLIKPPMIKVSPVKACIRKLSQVISCQNC